MKWGRLVTIGDLRHVGKMLEVNCMNCTGRTYVDTRKLLLGDLILVSQAAATLDCPRCKSRNSATRFPIYVQADPRKQIESAA